MAMIPINTATATMLPTTAPAILFPLDLSIGGGYAIIMNIKVRVVIPMTQTHVGEEVKSVLFQDTLKHCQLTVISLQCYKLEEEKTISSDL